MSNTPIQVTTDLSKVLEQINQKLDTIQKDVGNFRKEFSDFRTETKVSTESVRGDINTLKVEVNNIKEDIKGLKGSQKAQILPSCCTLSEAFQGERRTLIGILSTAVVGTVIRFFITAIPSKA